MKKVLLIADSNLSLSGVPVVMMSIVKALQPDYSFDIVVLKNNDMYFADEFKSFGGKIFEYHLQKPDNFIKKFFWLLCKYHSSVKKFIRHNIDLENYDVIHTFNEGFSFPFLKLSKNAGIKNRILHICSAASAYPQKKTFSQKIFNWYQKKAMKCSTNIFFVSEQSLRLNNYRNKGVVLYNTFDEKKFDGIQECKHQNLVLTHIATFSGRKNQLFSLEVVKLLTKKYPNIVLNIVGKELEVGYLQKINAFIESNNLQKNINIYSGNVDRVELNKKTSFMLYPSTMESFGLVLIETQSCGIHCFSNENIPHDADMGNVDFLPLDPKVWADSIDECFSKHKNKRKAPIGTERFGVSQFKDTLIKIYRKN